MPRTDENGKVLLVVLTYMLNRSVSAKEIYSALGISRNTFNTREKEDSFPHAEECRLLARGLGLNPIELMLKFGLVTLEQIQECVALRGGRSARS